MNAPLKPFNCKPSVCAPPLTERVYRVLFPFCGVGGGALGFKRAIIELERLGLRGRFEIMGGIECDPSTARDFTRLTGAPCLCARIEDLTPERLREFFGDECPDVVFFSPPCKPASGLLAAWIAATPKYKTMAMLGSVWVDLMFLTWPRGPRLTIMENVPRVRTRAPEMMAQIRASHRKHGYHITEASHDLGEVGGLGQHRDRLLFVARRKDVSSLLYQPIKRRVRSIGEVIGSLPLPGDPSAGPLHRLPAIEAITALRLALIPAGGDWRDLPSAVHLHPDFAALMGKRRGKKGGKGASEELSSRTPFNDVWRVVKMDDSAPCVTAGATPTAGGLSIADTRLKMGEHARTNILALTAWENPSRTITGGSHPSGGALSVADVRTRKPSHPHTYGVVPWDHASHTITGNTSSPGGGPFSVTDVRITCKTRENSSIYGVLPWDRASGCIVGHACHDNGRFSAADTRTALDNEHEERVREYIARCPFPVIFAPDGTIHRPLTTLECALLQTLRARTAKDGTDGDEIPLMLEGSKDEQRVKIGDMVPSDAAQRVAEQMLQALMYADAGSFALSSGGAVWVSPEREGLSAHDAYGSIQ